MIKITLNICNLLAKECNTSSYYQNTEIHVISTLSVTFQRQLLCDLLRETKVSNNKIQNMFLSVEIVI